MIKHKLIRLAVAAPVTGGALVILNAADRSVEWSEDQKMRFLKEEAHVDDMPREAEGPRSN